MSQRPSSFSSHKKAWLLTWWNSQIIQGLETFYFASARSWAVSLLGWSSVISLVCGDGTLFLGLNYQFSQTILSRMCKRWGRGALKEILARGKQRKVTLSRWKPTMFWMKPPPLPPILKSYPQIVESWHYEIDLHFIILLLSPSSLYLLQERPINPRDEILRQGMWLYSESQLAEKMAD